MPRTTRGMQRAFLATEGGAMNMVLLRRMLATALLAGMLSSLLLTAVQQLQVRSLIALAEEHEQAAQPHAPLAAAIKELAHKHVHAHERERGAADDHPAGPDRLVGTLVANISISVGFSLLLVAAMAWRTVAPGWRAGALWGVAGYTVFFVAPSLGLPPELPGTEAAPVALRQMWWLATAAATAGALLLLWTKPAWHWRLAAAGLLLLPHVVGAPLPPAGAHAAPAALAQAFVVATAMSNAASWIMLGSLTGYFQHKLSSATCRRQLR
jgi:cobalt transporter subunit CbtA